MGLSCSELCVTKFKENDRESRQQKAYHTVEYYSARKRKEVLICATTCMGPMLSDSSQTQKATYLLFASISGKSPEQAKGCG